MGSGTKTRDETQSELEILRARVAQLEHEREIRVQAEEALRTQRDLLDSIIEGTDDLIFAKDIEGRYVLMNSADARGFGKAVDEVVGLTDKDLFPPNQAKRVMGTDRQIIATGMSMVYEQDFGGPAHDSGTYLLHKYPRYDQDGRVIGVLGGAAQVGVGKIAHSQCCIGTDRLPGHPAHHRLDKPGGRDLGGTETRKSDGT